MPKDGYSMNKEIDERRRKLECYDESYELLYGLVRRKKFTLRISDELVSSDVVEREALPHLRKKRRWAKAALQWSLFALRWLPRFWDRIQEIAGLML